MLQDDDANSDSGLEPESPIARRKLFNIPSVKHNGKCNVLHTKIQLGIPHSYKFSRDVNFTIFADNVHATKI